MPSAHAILWFLGAFVILWAVSLVARGLIGDRSRGRRRCPACSKTIDGAGVRTCSACGYEAVSERALFATRRNWRMVAAGAMLVPVGVLACYFGVRVWGWTHRNYDLALTLTLWDSSAGALAVFGVVLIGWAVRGDRSRGRRRCPACWYDMTGSGLRCPECGHEARHVSRLYRARRNWKAAGLASLLLLGAVAAQGVPRVQRGGWRAAVPSTLLIAGLPWLPDALAFEEDPGAVEDWTLLARWESGRLWSWQGKWLVKRARGAIGRARTARDVLRSLHFAGLQARRPETGRTMLLCLRALSSGSKADQTAAVECLGEFQQLFPRPTAATAALVAPVVPELLAILEDEQQPPDVVWTAVWAVSLSGAAAEAAVPRILQIGAGAGRLRMMGVIGYLRNLAVAVPAIRMQIVSALDDGDAARVWFACEVLGHTSMCDETAAARLLVLARDGDDVGATAAAQALCRAIWRPRVAIPAILEQLQSGRAARAGFADWLWIYEDDLLAYLPRLAESLSDPDPLVRSAVLGAISGCERNGTFHLNRSALFPVIEAMKNDPDPNVSRAAATLVADTAPAVP